MYRNNRNEVYPRDRHPSETEFDYTLRRSFGLSRPDIIIPGFEASPIITPNLLEALVALQQDEETDPIA